MSVSSILLITTDSDACSLLNSAFTNSGVAVICLDSPSEGDILRFMDNAFATDTSKATLLLLDLDAPHGYRTTLLTKIRQHPYAVGIPLLTYSHNNDNSFVERIYSQGAVSYFKRPQNWNCFAQNLLAYWGYSEVKLPSDSEEYYVFHRRSGSPNTRSTYYPRSQSE